MEPDELPFSTLGIFLCKEQDDSLIIQTPALWAAQGQKLQILSLRLSFLDDIGTYLHLSLHHSPLF